MIDTKDFITGERFQGLCDVSIITPEILQFHKSIGVVSTKLYIVELCTEAILPPYLTEAKSIFVYTHILPHFFEYIFPRLFSPFVLVSHNSDHSVDEQFLPYLNSPIIIHWYAQNVSFAKPHHKITPLPIGIANSQWEHGNLNSLKMVMEESIQKTDKIYVNFNSKRGSIYKTLQECQTDRLYFDQDRCHIDYLREIKKYKYAISLPGTGIDCHRTWECLYLGVIPILERSNSPLYTLLNVAMIDDWRQVEKISITNPNTYHPMLSLKYWKDRMSRDLNILVQPVPKTISPAPRIVSLELYYQFTLNGKIRVLDWYIDQTQRKDNSERYTLQVLEGLIQKAHNRQENYYATTDTWLYQALNKYSIKNQEVVIMGSAYPWYEAICLDQNVSQCTVIEYNEINFLYSKLKYMTPDIFRKGNNRQFPFGISISSFEHDGLGRYGDPISPDGDLKAMTEMKTILQPRGILFLAVPIGKDSLVWNAHRIYGSIRLPMLLKGWEVVDTFGINYPNPSQLNLDIGNSSHYQPVFVLRNV